MAVRPPPSAKPSTHHSTTALVILLGILAVAALLRIPGLTQAPPGLNQDEACNAWNAWCLLKTGADQIGVPWPISYYRALGENRSASYLYVTIPFQALAGLNVWTTRLPAALSGVLCVALVCYACGRLFSPGTGLVAGGLLAVTPWHIQLSRLGLEAALAPTLVSAALSVLLWANVLVRRDRAPQAVRWLIAGLVVGGCCYGYAAVRIFIPAFVAASIVVGWRDWWSLARVRRGVGAILAFLLGLAATLGPLAWQQVTHPELISRRAQTMRLWEPGDPLGQRAAKVGERYFAHFGPDFLFLHGDHHEIQWTQGFGALEWYMLPLLVAGTIYALRQSRTASARIALIWLLLFPLADSFYRGSFYVGADGTRRMSLHILRSAPGLLGLTLLCALGAVAIHRLVSPRRHLALALCTLFGAAVALLDARFLNYYFRVYPRRPTVQLSFQPDLVEAAHWLRPRLAAADAVFVTTTRTNMPYIVMLVALDYDPRQWFQDERITGEVGGWDRYYRVGKMRFLYPDAASAILSESRQDDRARRAIFVLRPGEGSLTDPAQTIRGPDGAASLVIYETAL